MIASFGMALRYSFGMGDWADKLDAAISSVLAKGLRTKEMFEVVLSVGRTSAPLLLLLFTAQLYSRTLSMTGITGAATAPLQITAFYHQRGEAHLDPRHLDARHKRPGLLVGHAGGHPPARLEQCLGTGQFSWRQRRGRGEPPTTTMRNLA
jgi:hypothetical protein